jgi:uncharacterized protein YegP (UPF0339 family)
VAGGQNPLEMKASDIMSIDIATIKPTSSLEECFRAMEKKDIRRILVVDEQGRCCGIVAQADVAQNSSNPVRTTEFLREISESSPSHNMTMSRDWESNQSSFNVRSFLPVLLGIGSGAALIYYFGQRKASHSIDFNYQTDKHQPTPANRSFTNYTDADDEIGRRQRNLENRVQALKTEIQTVAESPEPSSGRFELKQSASGQYYFNLKAGNGQIILSSEMYNSKKAAENGIESVKRNAADSKRYERKTGQNNQPYFVLKAGNGEEIGKSETYSTESAMENGISSVMENAPNAKISETAS